MKIKTAILCLVLAGCGADGPPFRPTASVGVGLGTSGASVNCNLGTSNGTVSVNIGC
jgi:hypothetical protein